MDMSQVENFGAAIRILDDVWERLKLYPFFRGINQSLEKLPDLSFAAAEERSEFAGHILDKMRNVDCSSLPYDLNYTLDIAKRYAERWRREKDIYWLVFDPSGFGFYAMFAATPYGGGYLLNSLNATFKNYQFDRPGAEDRYIGLVRDYAEIVCQMLERTQGQSELGIRMPRLQLDQAIPILDGIRAGAKGILIPESSRLMGLKGHGVAAKIAAVVEREVLPAFDRFIEFLGDPSYRLLAPESVGLTMFEGGAEAYAYLVKHYTTMELTVDQVHKEGLQRVAYVRSQIQDLLDKVEFVGSPFEYLRSIQDNPTWRASDPGAIEHFFNRYITQIRPHLERVFNFKPKAEYGVEALPESLSKSMTFGFFSGPSKVQERGIYFYNAKNLSMSALNNIPALTYHELVPGHHFHIATQRENESLHPIRQNCFINAFNEGWAEYAATLAGELGMYREPEEIFGRLMSDAFLSCRLVVDTGMNALGWSIEEARRYLRENAFLTEAEIDSETIRYACDIPAQSLAYKLGEGVILEAREKMRDALGSRFDIRDFHDAVLRPGALPLPVVKQHVEVETRRIAEAHDLLSR